MKKNSRRSGMVTLIRYVSLVWPLVMSKLFFFEKIKTFSKIPKKPVDTAILRIAIVWLLVTHAMRVELALYDAPYFDNCLAVIILIKIKF